jgi:hypothetical protein
MVLDQAANELETGLQRVGGSQAQCCDALVFPLALPEGRQAAVPKRGINTERTRIGD